MYVKDDKIEFGVLRQGDILSNIRITGALNLNNIYDLVNQHGGPSPAWTVQAQPRYEDAMVLSHSCELDPANAVKVTSIILAPIRDVHKATPVEKITELIDSNLIDPKTTKTSYFKYFYVEPDARLAFPNGAVVDFSKCFSLRKQCVDVLIEKKILQLDVDVACTMALKLAADFYRKSA